MKSAFLILLTVSAITVSTAQTVTFGQFIERNGTNDFVFTNNGSSATFNTIANGTPVLFTYQNVPNLPAELQGVQLATVFVRSTTSEPATQTATTPPRNVQTFNQAFIIEVLRDTPATSGTGSRRNLLTAVVTPIGASSASISGDDGSNAAAFTASTPNQVVNYSSDFLGFLGTTSRNLGLTFSSLAPLYTIGPGGFLNSFTAAGAGTFASNPGPVFNPPTASNVTVSGRIFNSDGTSVRKAAVTLTDSNGESRKVYTNPNGQFTFENVPAGQIVTVSPFVKFMRFSPQVIDLQESINDLNFYPEK